MEEKKGLKYLLVQSQCDTVATLVWGSIHTPAVLCMCQFKAPAPQRNDDDD